MTYEVWLGGQRLGSGFKNVNAAVVLAQYEADHTGTDICHYEIRMRRT